MKNKSFAAGLKKLFGLYKGPEESFFEDLTDTLIEGDIGAKTYAKRKSLFLKMMF